MNKRVKFRIKSNFNDKFDEQNNKFEEIKSNFNE